MVYPRRFPATWKVEERNECFIVVDGSGQKLAHLYFEDEPIRQGILKRLGKDDAWRIGRAITGSRRCCAETERRRTATVRWPNSCVDALDGLRLLASAAAHLDRIAHTPAAHRRGSLRQ